MYFKNAVFCVLCTAALGLGQTAPPSYLIRDVRIFDGQRVFEHRSVLLENGKISWIRGPKANTPNAQVVEGAGRTLLPGLIDAHVHIPAFGAEAVVRQSLNLGVTTQLDMSSFGPGLKNVKKLEVEDGPGLADLRTAGSPATVPGGHTPHRWEGGRSRL